MRPLRSARRRHTGGKPPGSGYGGPVAATRKRLEEAGTAIRPLSRGDVDEMTELVVANRSHTTPWDPIRGEAYYSRAGQAEVLRRDLEAWDGASGYAFAILDTEDGDRIIGRVALGNVVLGAWRNATLGYWVSADVGGRGHATRAVRLTCRFAFCHAGLHRVQPAIIPRNVRSIRVAEKAGFRLEGRAVRYLNIAGTWEDHDLYAMTEEEWRMAEG
jgi:ribosomal-protein-alanine N-acetyltransferase